jgi:hypothetical protein
MQTGQHMPVGVDEKGKLVAALGTPDQRLRHVRNVTNSICRQALRAWADLWEQMQGTVVDGVLVAPEAGEGWHPPCGWPAFLEKMWILRSTLECAARITDPAS